MCQGFNFRKTLKKAKGLALPSFRSQTGEEERKKLQNSRFDKKRTGHMQQKCRLLSWICRKDHLNPE